MTDKPRVIRVERFDLFDLSDYLAARDGDVVVEIAESGAVRCQKIKDMRKQQRLLDPLKYADALVYYDYETKPHRDPFAYFANILNYPDARLVESFEVEATNEGVREHHPWVNPFWTKVRFDFNADRSIECVLVTVKTLPSHRDEVRAFNYSLGNSDKIREWTSNWFNWVTRPSVSALIEWPENQSPPTVVEYLKTIHRECQIERAPHSLIMTDTGHACVKSYLKSFPGTPYKLAPPQHHFDTESKDPVTGDFSGLLIRDPFWRFRWQTYHPIIVGAAMALPNIPNYVLLEILDWLPDFWKWPQWRKVRLIDSVRCSMARTAETRSKRIKVY